MYERRARSWYLHDGGLLTVADSCKVEGGASGKLAAESQRLAHTAGHLRAVRPLLDALECSAQETHKPGE